MKRTLIVLFSTALLTGAIAQTGRADFFANLTGAGKGKASWKLRDSAFLFQAQLEVGGENLPKNTALKVRIVNNTWNVVTDAFGRFKLTKTYTTSVRPVIGAGTVVRVTRTNGTVALSGSFVRTR
ncbi:MAG: hypothetical protein ABL949_08660 [Fimbriimonadaceae bacterium]